MGWLDHSTNNIILDAVLTDYGRQQLAAMSNQFKIEYFALGDDEVDYRLIKKYGRAVGKEKIEKNTPIFEALTNQSIALKYRLIGRESDGSALSLTYMPTLQTISTAALTKNSTKTVTFDLYYGKNTGTTQVPANLIQSSYLIRVPDRFFTISNPTNGTLSEAAGSRATIDAGDPNREATYKYTVNGNATSIGFTINHRNIDNTTLLIYGQRTANGARVIKSYIKIIGEQHGVTYDFPVSYTAVPAT